MSQPHCVHAYWHLSALSSVPLSQTLNERVGRMSCQLIVWMWHRRGFMWMNTPPAFISAPTSTAGLWSSSSSSSISSKYLLFCVSPLPKIIRPSTINDTPVQLLLPRATFTPILALYLSCEAVPRHSSQLRKRQERRPLSDPIPRITVEGLFVFTVGYNARRRWAQCLLHSHHILRQLVELIRVSSMDHGWGKDIARQCPVSTHTQHAWVSRA